jgi:hypothetical protein
LTLAWLILSAVPFLENGTADLETAWLMFEQ